MKEVEFGGAYSTNEGEEKCIQEFNMENVRKENAWKTQA
jgi:hypothetical protein